MEETQPDGNGEIILSIVVLNWNGKDLLKECIDSILPQADARVELIVVDNGSTDGSVDYLEDTYGDRVHLVPLDSNYGWAGGNNRGIEKARGSYVLLLNNDAVIGEGFIRAFKKVAEDYPGVGMFSPKILNYHEKGIIDNTGHVIYMDGINRGRGRLEADDEKYGDACEVLNPSGAAGIYRKDIFNAAGLIDEDFFLYGEDIDMGLRGRLMGYLCYYIPDLVVYHKYSATADPYSTVKAFYVERNRIWVLLKIFPLSFILLSPFFTLARYLVSMGGIIAKKGAAEKFVRQYSSMELVKTIMRAYASAFNGLGNILRKRRELYRKKVLSNREIRKLLLSHSMGVREISLKD